MNPVKSFLKCDSGVSSIEYAVIASAVVLVLVVVLPNLGSSLDGQYTSLSNGMK